MAKMPRKHAPAQSGKKMTAQTRGQFERDPKGRKGQFTAAGDSPIVKK